MRRYTTGQKLLTLFLGVFWLSWCVSLGAQDKPAGKPRLEDAAARALRKALPAQNNTKFFQATTFTSGTGPGDDPQESLVTVVEYANGDILIVQGGADPSQDHWIYIEQGQEPLLEHALYEARTRSREKK